MTLKVYLLGYERGEYSDYQAGVVGVYETEQACEAALASIAEWRKQRDLHNKNRIVALQEEGLDKCSFGYSDPRWRQFHDQRREFVAKWNDDNPHPEQPEAIQEVFPGGDFYAWDADFTITETEVRK